MTYVVAALQNDLKTANLRQRLATAKRENC